MANVSDIKQTIKTTFSTDISNKFDLDFSSQCVQSTDASQVMSGIKITGATDVDLKQMNQAIGLCALKTVMDMGILDELDVTAKSDLFDKLTSQTGLGVAVTNKTQDIVNEVKTKINTQVAIDMSQKCLQQMIATQELKNITIEDSKRINLSQINSSINQCITDGAAKLLTGSDIKSAADSTAKGDTTVKGMDPLASLAEIMGGSMSMLALMACSPIIISVCCVVAIFVIIPMISGGSKETAGVDEAGIDLGDAADVADNAGGVMDSVSGAMSLFKKGGGKSEGMSGQFVDRTALLLEYIGKKVNDFCVGTN